MVDFFKFKEQLNEASSKELKDLNRGDDVMVNGKMGMFYGMKGSKVTVKFPDGQKDVSAKDVEIPDLMMDDVEKDSDDPCWAGYVQLGTKMKNGKEVPNCVPMEEAKKMVEQVEKSLEEGKTEKELSKLMTKALGGKRPKSDYTSSIANNGDFVVSDGGGRVIGRIKKGDFENPMKEETVLEGKTTDDHWAIVKRNGSFYSGKSEIVKIMPPSKNGPSPKMVDKHGGDAAVRVGKLKKDLEGKRDTDKLMKQLSESYYDYPDYGSVGASEMKMTQLHFIKYAADEIIACLESGCVMPEWYQNKLAKVEGEVEGLLSYMKGKKVKAMSRRYSPGMYAEEVETLTEAKEGGKEEYRKFFDKALKKFGVKSPAELKGDKEKEFYNYIDKNWKSDKEASGDMSEAYINEVLKPSDDVSTWIEDFYKSDAPQFKGKDKEERREMAVAAWLEARREAGYDVDPNPNKD